MIERVYIINKKTKKVLIEFERNDRVLFIEKIKGIDFCNNEEIIEIEIITFGNYMVKRPTYQISKETTIKLIFDEV